MEDKLKQDNNKRYDLQELLKSDQLGNLQAAIYDIDSKVNIQPVWGKFKKLPALNYGYVVGFIIEVKNKQRKCKENIEVRLDNDPTVQDLGLHLNVTAYDGSRKTGNTHPLNHAKIQRPQNYSSDEQFLKQQWEEWTRIVITEKKLDYIDKQGIMEEIIQKQINTKDSPLQYWENRYKQINEYKQSLKNN